MFENLTNKFEEIFSSLKKAPSLDEKQVDEGLRGIRQALLEADVSLDVAKDFIEKVKPKALGQEIIRSTSPGDMIVKIVYDELVNLLGEKNDEINLNAVPPVSMMLVGLQGSGKTTTTAKLAKYLENQKKKKVMMVSLDIYRPAAQEQLKALGEQSSILTLPIISGQQPIDICRRAVSAANLNGAEIILFDTAGRTQIDLQMMSEIKQIESVINPTETFLVADSLTGQVAASVAKEFKNTVNLSGIILTRADGDARGGAAVSMKYVSQVPIKFLGIGEKIDNFEVFHPDRIANRILGMGDIVSLVEKAAQDLGEENIKKTEENLKKGEFSMEDYLTQLRQMKKMRGYIIIVYVFMSFVLSCACVRVGVVAPYMAKFSMQIFSKTVQVTTPSARSAPSLKCSVEKYGARSARGIGRPRIVDAPSRNSCNESVPPPSASRRLKIARSGGSSALACEISARMMVRMRSFHARR